MKTDFRFDFALSFCRVSAMGMIVACHLASVMGYSSIAQFLQVGVQIFLFISGYLYSKKEVLHSFAWIASRMQRICCPVYIFITVMLIYSFANQLPISWEAIVLDILNLEGYGHIVTFFPRIEPIAGTAHLWYITAILINYGITVIVKHFERNQSKCLTKWLLIGLFPVCLVCGCLGIRIDYIWIYLFGYHLGKNKSQINSISFQLVVGAMALMLACVRLGCKEYCDIHGDNNVYLFVVIPTAYNAIAAFYCSAVIFIEERSRVFERLSGRRIGRVFLFFDELSFYVYITHYCFIDGPISMMLLFENSIVACFVSILASFVSAYILMIVVEKINGIIKGKIDGK